MNNIKVLMLAGEGESSSLMFNGIKDSFFVEKVIIEAPVSKSQLLKRRAKKLGLMKVTGQIIFMLYNIWLKKKSQQRIIEIKNEKNIDEKLISNVDSVNSEETIELLKKYQPNVVVVNGTRIIKKKLLRQ